MVARCSLAFLDWPISLPGTFQIRLAFFIVVQLDVAFAVHLNWVQCFQAVAQDGDGLKGTQVTFDRYDTGLSPQRIWSLQSFNQVLPLIIICMLYGEAPQPYS
jgi:hypothetical protein